MYFVLRVPCNKNYSTASKWSDFQLSSNSDGVSRGGGGGGGSGIGSKCARSLGVSRWTSDHGVRYESAPTLARNAILIRTEQGPEQCIKVMDLAYRTSLSQSSRRPSSSPRLTFFWRGFSGKDGEGTAG
ncbi:hypothetical protein Trydic_g17433 [Trypoxylus dichotomus]